MILRLEFPIPLNKFEKYDLIIKLHKEGKTYSEIAHIAHVSVRDIKPTLKKYERKLEYNKGKENNQTKEPSLSSSSRAFILYQKGKKISEVKVLLDIPFKKAMMYWAQYLKSIRMFESFEFYQEFSYDIPTFLSINNFIKRNNISGNNIANVLKTANDVINLNQTILNLKGEIEKLKQNKNNYSLNQTTNNYQQPVPLGPLPRYYNW